MDFFTHQDQARKRTKQLVLLFLLSVVAIIILTNVLLAAVFYGSDYASAQKTSDVSSLIDYFSATNFLYSALGITSFILIAALYKWIQLKGGGHQIAESLGGRLVNIDTDDFYQKRLLNIVEEMALASSMPVPSVYLLDNEIGINAFAAGYQSSDAVIGITKGALEKLSRKQLQGVVGHEFSHILNGDMRLNIRLIAILHGILCISLLGRFALDAGGHSRLHSSRRSSYNKDSAGFIIFGIGLVVIGYVGVFFGNIIKAAVSRQREYLADASAVQFTRDPSAVADALKVIGYSGIGSAIGHSKRDEMSHLFFGSALFHNLKMFATHPPLDDRIGRIDKHWDGEYIQPQTRQQAETESPQFVDGRKEVFMTGLAAAAAASINFPGRTGDAKQEIHESEQQKLAKFQLQDGVHQTYSAQAIIYATLLADINSLVHEQQLELIRQHHDDATLTEVRKWYKILATSENRHPLTLTETCIPTLKSFSEKQYAVFVKVLSALVKADGKIDIYEWCLYRLIVQYLSPQFKSVKPIKMKYGKINSVKPALACVLSFVAQHGHDSLEEAQASFSAACDAVELHDLQLQAKTHSFKEFNEAIKQLTAAYPHVKGRVLKALATCVKHMGTQPIERDLVMTIAALLETPVPELFD